METHQTASGPTITCKGPLYSTKSCATLIAAGWKPLGARCITTDPSLVYPLASRCDEKAQKQVMAWAAKRLSAVHASMAMSSDEAFPAPPGLAYRDYQNAGIAFMKSRKGTLNADVMRLGKTIQTLGVCNTYDRPLRVLVVCLSNGKLNWVREAEKWLIHKTTIGYAEGDTLPDVDFLVINYDILARHIHKIRKMEWDIIVADESRRIKNPRSGRSQAFFSIPYPKLHYFFLDGTPMTRFPVDLWPLMQVLDPQGLGRHWYNYIKTYCGATKENGWDKSGATNCEELQYRMRKTFMIRREKKDVSLVMPKEPELVMVPVSSLRAYKSPEDEDTQQTRIREIIAKAEEANALDNLEAFDRSYAELLLTVGNDLQGVGKAKIPLVVEFIEQLLEQESKVVSFGWNRAVVDGVTAGLEKNKLNVSTVKGGLSTGARDDAIMQFKEDPDVKVFNANLQAAGSSISLKEADVCVLYQFHTPDTVEQAQERIWDVTKEVPTTIYYMVVEDSCEHAQVKLLLLRSKLIKRVMDRANLAFIKG